MRIVGEDVRKKTLPEIEIEPGPPRCEADVYSMTAWWKQFGLGEACMDVPN